MSFRSYDIYRLVKDYGEPLTLTKKTATGSYNPATSSVDGSATTDYSVLGYFYNYEVVNYDQVRRGARKCAISALNVSAEPEEGDYISGNGDQVTISSVTTIFSDGMVICYICHTEE